MPGKMCPSCGSEVPAYNKFCGKCGANVDAGPAPPANKTTCFGANQPSKMRLLQRRRGGEIGMIYRSRGETITIGREGNDVNFLDDPFISGKHAQVSITPDGQVTLSDLGSKNGTFVKINEEGLLNNGDYVFLGQQLLRVEVA